MKKYESFAHFLNVVKYIKKKRNQGTYISKSQYTILCDLYNEDETKCSDYIDYCRREKFNTEISEYHVTLFLSK